MSWIARPRQSQLNCRNLGQLEASPDVFNINYAMVTCGDR